MTSNNIAIDKSGLECYIQQAQLGQEYYQHNLQHKWIFGLLGIDVKYCK